jgi:hypothetical protein
MAAALDWEGLSRYAKKNIRPQYRKLRRMDADDWLATVGLERRNVAVDVASAVGFICLGTVIGIGVGLLMAPKRGSELRRELNQKVRDTADRVRDTAERGRTREESFAS